MYEHAPFPLCVAVCLVCECDDIPVFPLRLKDCPVAIVPVVVTPTGWVRMPTCPNFSSRSTRKVGFTPGKQYRGVSLLSPHCKIEIHWLVTLCMSKHQSVLGVLKHRQGINPSCRSTTGTRMWNIFDDKCELIKGQWLNKYMLQPLKLSPSLRECCSREKPTLSHHCSPPSCSSLSCSYSSVPCLLLSFLCPICLSWTVASLIPHQFWCQQVNQCSGCSPPSPHGLSQQDDQPHFPNLTTNCYSKLRG